MGEKKEVGLTVGQLRERIAAFPDDLPVLIEGCDCEAFADDVVVDDSRRGQWWRKAGCDAVVRITRGW